MPLPVSGLRSRQSSAEGLEWSKGIMLEASLLAKVVGIKPFLQHGSRTISRQRCPTGGSKRQMEPVDSENGNI